MRLEVLQRRGADRATSEGSREVTAAVARQQPAGGVMIEFGSADGPPEIRLTLSANEVGRLIATLRAAAGGDGEQVMLADE